MSYREAVPPTALRPHVARTEAAPHVLATAWLLGALGAAALGALYAYFSFALPWVKVHLLLPLALGACVGFLDVGLMNRFHVRSRRIFLASAVAFALIAWLAAWQAWLETVFASLGAESTPTVFEPQARLAIGAVLEHGTWSLSSSTDPVAGWPLAAAWIGELVFIVGFATLVASQRSRDRVYCEECGTWCTLLRDRARFDPASGPALRASIVDRGDFEVLQSTAEAPGAEPWLALTLAFCARCGKTNAIAIHDVSPARGRKRGAGHKELLYVPYHVVSEDRMRALRARIGA